VRDAMEVLILTSDKKYIYCKFKNQRYDKNF